MKLPDGIEGIEVFYDGRCGMCCSFHEWIARQPRAFRIEFIPYQSPDAERVFPGLGTLDPAREMVVRTRDHRVFRGAEAWVWCLYSCANHQAAARRLGGPALLPVAIQACRALAANRQLIARGFSVEVIGRLGDEKVEEMVLRFLDDKFARTATGGA